MPNYEDYNFTNYYNSDEDSIDQYNYVEMSQDDYIYDPEEQSITKYNLINYEIYNPYIHGKTNSSMYTQLLVCDRYKYKDTDSMEEIIYHSELINMLVCEKMTSMPNCIHPYIRNFRTISMQTSGKLEIAECIYCDNGEMVAILKTFWLKIIQRKWKNVFKEQNRIKRLRMRVATFIYREINGEWPEECKIMPRLKGMLNDLLFYETPHI